jgi:predicted Zn-dependent protease
MKPAWNPLAIALNAVLLISGMPVLAALPPSPQNTTRGEVSSTPIQPNSSQIETTPTQQPTEPPTFELEASSSRLAAIIERRKKLMEADRLHQAGQHAEAEKLYREVKEPFTTPIEVKQRPEPIVDVTQLSPAGRVYWREAEAGIAQNLQTRTLVPLRLLVVQYPQFIPGHLQLATALTKQGHAKEAIDVLERATSLYPNQPELVKAKIQVLAAEKKWLEASLAARQFAILNASQPQAEEFTQLANAHLELYKRHTRRALRGNAIANVITGIAGYALTGSLLGPLSALQTGSMLLRGESAIGNSIAKSAREQLPMVEDKMVIDYVNEIGQKLSKVSGRDDFQYEFYVVLDDNLNAFALPGGKVFVNAGAIAKTESEAELAGLLAHELSHAVLSHGFQLAAEGNLLANITQYIPYGGTVTNIFAMGYSRTMERQADALGTRLIAASGYAADGLRNLLVTLKEQDEGGEPPTWLSSHPKTSDRVRFVDEMIQRHGYNRYTYEGVARHAEMKARVEAILIQKELIMKKKHHR